MTTGAGSQYDPHFFQPLLPGFRQMLSIPEAFMSMYLEDELKNRKYETIHVVLFMKRNHMIRKSVVHLRGRDLVEGWSKFIDDHDPYLKMEVNNILVFKYKGNMVFEVSVFDSTGCEKKNMIKTTTTNTITISDDDSPLVNSSKKKMITSKKEKIEESRPCKKRKTPKIYPYFDSVIKRRQNVPIEFVRENGLERNCKLILKGNDGGRGRGRRLEVEGNFCTKYLRFYMSKGWKKFLSGNGLGVVGDCFRFYLIKKAKNPIFHFNKLHKKKKKKNHDEDVKEDEDGDENDEDEEDEEGSES